MVSTSKEGMPIPISMYLLVIHQDLVDPEELTVAPEPC